MINNSGNCNNNGADITEANCVIPVPTLSEWGIFLFGLVVMTLGLVSLYNFKLWNTELG
jgi:hypothetical protein